MDNLCNETLVLGGVEISPGERHRNLDIAGRKGDTHLLTRNAAKLGECIPAADESIVVLGTLGDQQV